MAHNEHARIYGVTVKIVFNVHWTRSHAVVHRKKTTVLSGDVSIQKLSPEHFTTVSKVFGFKLALKASQVTFTHVCKLSALPRDEVARMQELLTYHVGSFLQNPVT